MEIDSLDELRMWARWMVEWELPSWWRWLRHWRRQNIVEQTLEGRVYYVHIQKEGWYYSWYKWRPFWVAPHIRFRWWMRNTKLSLTNKKGGEK